MHGENPKLKCIPLKYSEIANFHREAAIVAFP